MKVLATTLLLGAASAAVFPEQQVLQAPHDQAPHEASQAWAKPLHTLQTALNSLTAEARAVWDEVSLLFPEDMAKASFFSSPKKHARRPDHEWDHIVRGADVQSVWVENASGEKEREIDGKLDAYDMRIKKVDPSELGVDPDVKQFSGYLDDNENDKHLFYCKRFKTSP